MKCCLTVAGSDSGGNAGVQADLRAFHAYGVHGCTVFSALTAQNPSGVSGVLPVPPDFVAAQLDAVLGAYPVAAAKTGMFAEPEAVAAVAERFAAHRGIALVVDPVMVATSGAALADAPAIEAVKRLLMPLATVITPNIPEAEALCGAPPGAVPQDGLARRLYGLFGVPVLVKGGHLAGGEAEDCLFDGRELLHFSLPRIVNPASTHGTGCSLAAAIAAELALGRPLPDAVAGAKAYVRDAIASSAEMAPGCAVLGFAPRPARG